MRQITKEDYYIGIQSPYRANKSAYYKAKKLNYEQIEKFVKAKSLIGYEVSVLYRGKKRKCVIVAVSLPDSISTTYLFENGEEYSPSSYPYDIFINFPEEKIESVWFNNIECYDFNSPFYKGVHFEAYGSNYSLK